MSGPEPKTNNEKAALQTKTTASPFAAKATAASNPFSIPSAGFGPRPMQPPAMAPGVGAEPKPFWENARQTLFGGLSAGFGFGGMGPMLRNPLLPQSPVMGPAPLPTMGPTPLPTMGPAPLPGQNPVMGPAPAPTVGSVPAQTTPTTDPNNPGVPTQPASAPAKPVDPKEISQLAADIRKETDGHWFANPASTLSVLRGRSPEEVAAIKAEYQAHYGTSLDQALGSGLSGKDKAEYDALMAQDSKDPASRAKAAIASLQNAEKDNFLGINGKHADKAAVEQVLKGLDPTTRAELQKQGFNLDGYLQQYYSGDELKKVSAQATGDKAAELAADLKMATNTGWFGASTDKNKILDTLAQCTTEEERKAVAEAYKQISNGQDLSAMVGDKLKNEDQKAAQALLDGKPEVAAAYQVEAASKPTGPFSFIGIGGPDTERMNKQFEGKSPEECKAIRDAYNATIAPPDKKSDPNFNAFDAKLSSTLSGDELMKTQQLAQEGKVSDELAIKMSMNTGLFGMFTDDKAVNKVLEGKTKAEIEELKKKYADLTGQDMEKQLVSRTGGDAGFEVQMNLKGKPETPEEMVARANERHEHQRGNPVRNFFVDTFGGEAGKDLDRQNQRINTAYDKAKEGDGQVDQGEFAQISQLADWNKIDAKAVQERTDSIANAAGTVASVTAGVALTIATAGAASPVRAAALVAGGSGAAMMATKALVKGGGYGGDELKSDLVDTGFSMAGGMATAGIGQLMQGAKMDAFMRNVLKIDPTKAAAQLSAIEKMKMSVLSKGLEGGLGGLASAATSRKNWEGGADDFLANMLKDGAMGFGKGAFGGFTGSLPGMFADKDFAKEHPGMMWMQKIPGMGDPAAKDKDFGMGRSILNGLVSGTGKAATNFAVDTVMDTVKDGNAWSDGNLWNSLLENGQENLNEGKWAKDMAGGVKDGVMSNRWTQNQIRNLVGAPQIAAGTAPSTWGGNLSTMEDRYKVGAANGGIGSLFGGLIDSTVDSVTPANEGKQNKGMMFLNNMFTGTMNGIQGGVSGVDADRRSEEASLEKEILRRMWNNWKGTDAPTGDSPQTEKKLALRDRLEDLYGPLKQSGAGSTAAGDNGTTGANATTEGQPTETNTAAQQARDKEIDAHHSPLQGLDHRDQVVAQTSEHEFFPNAPAGLDDQDVFEHLSR